MSAKPLTSRQIQAQESRRKIFDAALELIKEKGYDNVGIGDICERAGFSIGAFYHYFDSKEQIVLERYLPFALNSSAYFEEIYERVRKEEQNSFDRLIKCTTQGLQPATMLDMGAAKVLFRKQFGPMYMDSPLIMSLMQPHDVINRIVKEGQEAGEIRDDIETAEITNMLIQNVFGIICDWIIRDGSFEVLQTVKQYFEMMRKGIEKP